jgi:hypothetical protein
MEGHMERRPCVVSRIVMCGLAALGMTPLAYAQPAAVASITYEEISRPDGLPESYAAPAGVDLKFFRITTLDGFDVQASFFEPRSGARTDRTLVIGVHGSGGGLASNTVEFTVPMLSAEGFATMGIRTRQWGAHVNTDNFFDVARDIQAAVYTARHLGFKKIVLHGQSLGNIHVQYYAATNWDPDVKAVVLTAMFGDLPWKSRHLLAADEENYWQMFRHASDAVRKGTPGEVLPLGMRWTGREAPVPMTAQHFLTYRFEPSGTADGTYWIGRIPKPILMVRDEMDATVHAFEPYMLLSSATAQGSMVPAIKYVLLPKGGNDRNGHGFVNNQRALVRTMVTWLREQGL